MAAIVGEYERSGQSRAEFCAAHGLPVSTLDFWRRRVEAQPRMVEVRVEGEMGKPRQDASALIVRLRNGRAVEAPADAVLRSGPELAALLALAEQG
jgi:transposase-like protein